VFHQKISCVFTNQPFRRQTPLILRLTAKITLNCKYFGIKGLTLNRYFSPVIEATDFDAKNKLGTFYQKIAKIKLAAATCRGALALLVPEPCGGNFLIASFFPVASKSKLQVRV
jgi:hypothetical protein